MEAYCAPSPSRDGQTVDVLLGFDTLETYRGKSKFIGAMVGRYANRIAGAAFDLNGVRYPLAANSGTNHIHGGRVGFDKQLWTVEAAEEGCGEILRAEVRWVSVRVRPDRPSLCCVRVRIRRVLSA